MSDNNKQGITISKKTFAVIIIFLVLLLVAGGVMVGMKLGGSGSSEPTTTQSTAQKPELDDSAVKWQGEQPLEKPQTEDGQPGIALPGYKSITLKANTEQQTVNLYNPDVNDCYFVMSLILNDGTTIWKSKMVPPGNGLYEITLNQKLAAGDYENTVLKYECFKCNDDLTPLNGGEVKLTLEVK